VAPTEHREQGPIFTLTKTMLVMQPLLCYSPYILTLAISLRIRTVLRQG